jgi:NAD(P)-dependent dehydrogenase (short-subunit alcohol dehydrogenase family)
VVVTGGTGALGRAVVDALLAAGAHCHVPYRQEKEKESLPGRALNLIPAPSLADEAVVRKLYGALPTLWASIHIAGGFAFAPLTDTSGELLRRLIDDNLVSCFLCCREAVTAMRRGKASGRIVSSRPWSRVTGRTSAPLPPPRPASPHSRWLWGRNWRGREPW